MSAAPTLRTDVRLHRMRAEGDALDAETGALLWEPGVTYRELDELSRRYAAPSPEALDAGCVRAVGGCSCVACEALAADAAMVRDMVADKLVDAGVHRAAAFLVRRGILDGDALDVVLTACEVVGNPARSPSRTLLKGWVKDLAAGRVDRIDRSAAVWSRPAGGGRLSDCVCCALAAFETAAECCADCAGQVTP